MIIELNEIDLKDIKEFIKEMHEFGHQRDHRINGDIHRTAHQIEENQFLGKCGEVALRKWLISEDIEVSEVNYEVTGYGEYDDGVDLIVNGNKIIDIKSSKGYSKYLLLESNNFKVTDDRVSYVNNHAGRLPSFIFAVKVTPNNDVYTNSTSVTCDIVGYYPKKVIEESVKNKTDLYLKGQNIPGTGTILDADNYIFDYNDLYRPESILNMFR